MRVLALETSGRVGSIALLDGAAADGTVTVREEAALPAGERTARSLTPAMDALLRRHGCAPSELGLIAATTGPGSFTGLRIGVVAAKTLAYACGAKLVGVHTLAALAEAVDPSARDALLAAGVRRLWAVLDAQRQELFAASFELHTPVVDQAMPATDILGVDAWLAHLTPEDAVTGPPLAKLSARLPPGVTVVEARAWSPSAAATGGLAVQLLARGTVVPPLELVPNYFRKSAAEEKTGSG